MSSVKDTIRRTKLKGAAEADGILAVKFIKLLSLARKQNSFLLFFFFPFSFRQTVYFKMSLLYVRG